MTFITNPFELYFFIIFGKRKSEKKNMTASVACVCVCVFVCGDSLLCLGRPVQVSQLLKSEGLAKPGIDPSTS
jgi:hypothetical protein